MTEFVKKRPTAISVIGWYCIVFSSYWVIASILNVSHWLLEPPPKTTHQLSVIDSFWDFIFFCMMNIDSICCIVQIIAGIYLLKLRPWSRTTIEVISWLEILFHVIMAMVFAVFTLPCQDPGGLAALFLAKVRPTALFWTFKFTALAVVNGIIIYFLRSKKVRDAFATPPRVMT